MKVIRTMPGAILVVAFSLLAAGGAESLDSHLESFRPLLGKTWRGEFKNSKPDKPMVDVAHWERVLNGKAIRVVHSVNGGLYGGESIIRWDEDAQQIAFHYFTTAGFMTTGTTSIEGKKFISTEKVTGTNGVTEVRSVSELRADGTMLSKAEYSKNGKVTGSREVLYREAPEAEVKFK